MQINLLLFFVFIFLCSVSAMSMPGGFKPAESATAEEQEILDSVKGSVEATLGKQFSSFTAVQFSTQVVAGVNYMFKVKTDGEEYLHVKVHKPLPHTGKAPELMTCSAGHGLDTPML